MIRCLVWIAWVGVFPALFGLNLDLGYYLHLAKGQARLLWNREPVSRVLKRRDLSPQTRERLLLVQEIRRFAQRELGLERSRSYTSFVDIGKGPVSWNVTACPKDDLDPVRWSYPVVGSAPYRGFFDRQRAEKERDRLAARGYDTYLYPVSAYSTLGWFSDPILSTMLRYRDGDLASLIIHELTHATVWVSGHVTFNESLASFVGDAGALLWLEQKYGRDSEQVQAVLDGRADQKVFRQFMQGVAAELDTVYRSEQTFEQKMASRERIFQAAQERFRSLSLRTARYDYFLKWEVNNARIALYKTYNEEVAIFDRAHRALEGNLRATIEMFKRLEGAENPEAALEKWLRDHP